MKTQQKNNLVQKLAVLFTALLVFSFTITTTHAYTPVVTTQEEEEPEIELTPVGDPFTPEGNLTLVDDIYTNNEGDKQFITAVSKSGYYFYLVIDRAGDTDNVYLLNMVDEADLMSLMYEEPVDVTYTLQTEGEPEPEPEPLPEPEPEPEITEEVPEENSSTLPLILLAVLGGGGAFYFLKIKPSQKVSNTPMFDDYDEEEDEEEQDD